MNAIAKQDNPFGSPAIAARESEATVAVEQSRAVAEVQAAMFVAKKFPRDPMVAMDRILNACTRATLAEQALYVYSRGGTEITGPSIRLAEALAQAWGNIKTSVRELDQRDGVSSVQTIAWDLESGYQADKVFQVKHWRDRKNGEGYRITDARDIYEMVANQGARRLRACILAVIPGDVVEAAVKQCETTLKTKAEVTPERLANLLEKFAEFGVTKEQIQKRIQRHIDAMTPAQMVDLGKKYNSLKDGMSTVGDWFELDAAAAADAGEGGSTGASKLRQAARKAAERPAATTSDQAPTAAAGAGVNPVDDGPAPQDEAKALLMLDGCETREEAEELLDLCRDQHYAKRLKEALDKRFPAPK